MVTMSKKPTALNWLITGGCGFIGTNLIKRLVKEKGHRIRVLDNLSVGSEDDLGSVCESKTHDGTWRDDVVALMTGDITDEITCRKAAEGADVIVHLAANTGVGPSVENPRADMASNVVGTFNLLESARSNQVTRFIFASSGAPVGECEPPIHEEIAPHPVSPYGASKLAGEGYCSAYYKTFGVVTVGLRFGNVYGPGSTRKNSIVAKFIKKSLRKETVEIYGDGFQTRDFIYIDDLVDAILCAVEKKGVGGEVFQIATNRETTVSEIFNLLKGVLNGYGIKDVKCVNSETRLGDVKRNFSDTSKARIRLSWSAKYTLEHGLKNTVEWFLSAHNSN